MSRVLVTGGAGFIGRRVVRHLLHAGHEVVVIDKNPAVLPEELENAHVILGDICDENIWRTLNDFDYVFHLAADISVQESIKNPIGYDYNNVGGTLRVLEYCRKNNAKLIFSSSCSVYEDAQFPVTETDPKNPKSPYAMQKLMCEQYIRLYHKLHGVNYAVLRYFNVFGHNQRTSGAYAPVIGVFKHLHETGQPLTIFGDGEQVRDFVHVDDVAAANVMAMDWFGTYNIASGFSYSVNEIAEMYEDEKVYLDGRPGEVQVSMGDSSKAKHAGWRPSYTVKKWIEDDKSKH